MARKTLECNLETLLKKKSYKVMIEGHGVAWVNVKDLTVKERVARAYEELTGQSLEENFDQELEVVSVTIYQATVRLRRSAAA